MSGGGGGVYRSKVTARSVSIPEMNRLPLNGPSIIHSTRNRNPLTEFGVSMEMEIGDRLQCASFFYRNNQVSACFPFYRTREPAPAESNRFRPSALDPLLGLSFDP